MKGREGFNVMTGLAPVAGKEKLGIGTARVVTVRIDPFGDARPRLLRRVKEAPLRVNPEPLGLSSGRRQAQAFHRGVEGLTFRRFLEKINRKGGFLVKRSDGRGLKALRQVRITGNYLKHAEGSVLMELGDTKVICSASVEERVPPFLRNTGKGWVTAEYSMLPRSTNTRTPREKGGGGGRTFEIQRLIGRSLRSVTDLGAFGEKTVWIDCDVIQADGGTRTASITGAYVALVEAFQKMVESGMIEGIPVKDSVAAVSVGKVGGEVLLDLNYEEDSKAEVDMNVVMTGGGKFVEIQGTAEGDAFTKKEMDGLIKIAESGIKILTTIQKKALHGKGWRCEE